MGYAGTKFLSETMIWKRAPVSLTKCSKPGSEKAAAADVSKKAVETSQNATKETKVTVHKMKSEDASSKKAETAAKPETKNKPKGTLAKVAKAVTDMNEGGGKGKSRSGSKRNCRFSVPYLNMVVKVPCDG